MILNLDFVTVGLLRKNWESQSGSGTPPQRAFSELIRVNARYETAGNTIAEGRILEELKAEESLCNESVVSLDEADLASE